MIRNCGIYSIKRDGAFNAPFVALNDEQAIYTVKKALEGCEKDLYPLVAVYRIGTLDFFDGITDTDLVCVLAAGDLIDDKEVADGEISETV